MCKQTARLALTALLSLFAFLFSNLALADGEPVKGIYITQTTVEDTPYFRYLINQAKAVGINTFVVDLELPSKRYQRNIELLKVNHINYVARITIFPNGGTPEQVESQAYWEKKYRLINYAIGYGADEIQLDYIRYNTKQKPSQENAENILKVIAWYKNKLREQHIPLQVDVFGISSFGESKYIGQNLMLFSQSVDTICPMVYPSHYEPYLEHAVTPYKTVYSSLKSLRKQLHDKAPVKVIAYIEIFNYRYPLSGQKRIDYVSAEMKAVKDAGADGWYVWSAHNEYDFLFRFLKNQGNAGSTEQVASNAPKQVNVASSQSVHTSLPIDPPYCSLTNCRSVEWNVLSI